MAHPHARVDLRVALDRDAQEIAREGRSIADAQRFADAGEFHLLDHRIRGAQELLSFRHEGITGYIDALYFTVTSLTTTGYGDIILPGVWGRLLSIAVMLGGVSLFIRLIQSLVRPHKAFHPCPVCGLQRHDPDAVHCKACGETLNIPNEGS